MEMKNIYVCPDCGGQFLDEDMAAFRDNGEWKPMCPNCLNWDELVPVQEEGWYLDAKVGTVYLGTNEEVLSKLLAGECLGEDFDGHAVTMRTILEYELDEDSTPPSFHNIYGDRFDWGKAWLDGRLTGYSPADWLTELLSDDEVRENGTLWCNMTYVGVKR